MCIVVSRVVGALGLLLVLIVADAAQPAAAASVLGSRQASARPTLTVTPEQGSCTDRFIARGERFPPGESVTLVVRPAPPARGDNLATLDVTVGPAGSFAIEIPPDATRCLPSMPQPPGERRWELLAEIGQRVAQPGTIIATTTFTVSSSPAPAPGLPHTGNGRGYVQGPPAGGALIAAGLVIVLGRAIRPYRRLRRRSG